MRDSPATIDVTTAIVGAGPAGIAAAVRAAAGGGRVALIDEGLRPGGQIWRHRSRDDLPPAARAWLERLDRASVAHFPATAVVDATVGVDARVSLRTERDGIAGVVRCRSVVLATGARERFLPFIGWTLPGVIGAGGAQALFKSGVPVRGKRVVVAGSGPLLLAVAATLARAGAKVTLVAEQASARRVFGFAAGLLRRPGTLVQAARYRAALPMTRYATDTWIEAAHGDSSVREAIVRTPRSSRTISCDLLCVGYGLVPSTELARVLGCELAGEGVRVDAGQGTSVPGVFCAGESLGIGGVECALVEGEIAGLNAAGAREPSWDLLRARDRARRDADALARAFSLREELRHLGDDATIVCRCEDVALRSIDPRWTARQAKLYTRAGMGACQGRVCGAALRFRYGWDIDTVRPPIVPVKVGTLIV